VKRLPAFFYFICGLISSRLVLRQFWKSLEKRAFAERQYFHVAQSAKQLKPNLASTLLTEGEDFPGFERGLMHKTVRIVMDAINATLVHKLSRCKFFLHSPDLRQNRPPRSSGEMLELTF